MKAATQEEKDHVVSLYLQSHGRMTLAKLAGRVGRSEGTISRWISEALFDRCPRLRQDNLR